MEKYEKFRKLKQFRWYKLKSMLKKVTAFVLVFLLTMGIFPAREVEAVGYLKDGIKVPYKVLNDGTIRIGPVTHEMVKNEHDTVYIISCTLEDDPRYKRMYYYYLSASKSFVYNLPLDMVRNGLPEGNYKVDIDLASKKQFKEEIKNYTGYEYYNGGSMAGSTLYYKLVYH